MFLCLKYKIEIDSHLLGFDIDNVFEGRRKQPTLERNKSAVEKAPTKKEDILRISNILFRSFL